MKFPTPRLPLLAAILSLFLSTPALADRPLWTPLAELLLGSIGEADPLRMADVMSRCTALNITLGGLASDYSPESAELYRNEAHRLIQQGVIIESQVEEESTGKAADIAVLSDSVVAKVQGMVTGYGQWMDDNMASGESYFDKDLELEIDSCQLVSRMVNQLRVE